MKGFQTMIDYELRAANLIKKVRTLTAEPNLDDVTICYGLTSIVGEALDRVSKTYGVGEACCLCEKLLHVMATSAGMVCKTNAHSIAEEKKKKEKKKKRERSQMLGF